MKINNSRVVIMMATYNGEKYLKQQLDSIEKQTFNNWRLIVSDDRSNDKTLQILNDFKAKDKRLINIISNNGQHGPFANFYNVMRYIKNNYENQFEYFFYSDQDDIWVNDKVEYELKKIKAYEKKCHSIPIICYSDLALMEPNGKLSGKSLTDFTHIQLENPNNIFFSHRYIWGTTMIHNKALWDLINLNINIPKFISHDHYIGKYAAAYGKIIFLNRNLVNYRRHGSNVSGVPVSYTMFSGLKRLFTKFPIILANHAGTYWTSLYFIKYAPYKTDFLIELEKCFNKGGIVAWKFVNKYKICTSKNIFNIISFKLILYLKLYKLWSGFKLKM